MDKDQGIQEDNEQDNNSKYNSVMGDIKKFNIQLTGSQVHVIEKLLPKGYSLQTERENKNKRTSNKKKINIIKKDMNNNVLEIEEPSQRITKIKSAQRYNQDMGNLNNYTRAASQNYYDEIDDFMKPCLRILHMLKNHKTSWPFKQPVDPIALNIPNYLDIIKQPMDLQTVQKNLKTKVYATPTQFHADIGKIIRNSYQFNKNNVDFCKLTSEFEQYYNKISNDSSASRSMTYQTTNINNQTNIDLKKKKSKQPTKPAQNRFRQPSGTQPATLAQKKILTSQIKKLPKEYLKEVIEIVYEGKTPSTEQLNIDNLPNNKIRQLQRYVREKSTFIDVPNTSQKNQQQELNQARDEESSFQSDSDT